MVKTESSLANITVSSKSIWNSANTVYSTKVRSWRKEDCSIA